VKEERERMCLVVGRKKGVNERIRVTCGTHGQ
jgi:hypothetical protein